ncbi:MAG: nucleotidyltransferase family protein [Chloroflexi bacterium]|nr:nucleotidyltransferase family protein [Chloroflexota bacterium]MYD16202.1 nucleotidyltransferase family protein [Chloroflexota bacterium]MYJ01773.1 nucleotidyltransferase family protein [Chloroflexota bacterium]
MWKTRSGDCSAASATGSTKRNPMIAAILLAAGESARMGRPKQLLDWGGTPLVTAQVETLLAAGCRPVVVVLGAHEQRVRSAIPVRADVQIATNRQWSTGRASSIRAGARAVPSSVDAVLVSAVDQPTRPEVVTRLSEALQSNPTARIAVPRHDGRNGHPPLFDASLLPELQSVAERHEGLREVRRRHAEHTMFVNVDDPIVTLNLNTPEAYQNALTLL